MIAAHRLAANISTITDARTTSGGYCMAWRTTPVDARRGRDIA
jgi:hypothetical protein